MHHDDPARPPRILQAMRQDLADWRQWGVRLAVLAHAVGAGLAVVAFTWLSDRALEGFHRVMGLGAWLPFVWVPACCAAIVWLTRRWFPGAAGSGIPQVMAGLSARTDAGTLPLFVSLRLSIAKALLTSAGLLGGLAIGREGPSVQIAAGVMLQARRWLPARAAIQVHGLLVAGGAAGIAAAFNAPLAGVMFAIEELSRNLEQRSSGLIIAAIVVSGLVAVSAFGNAAYFGALALPPLPPACFVPALLVALAAGVLGGLFSRLLLASIAGQGDRCSRWRRRRPVLFAAGCGLAIAAIGWASQGSSFGSGYEATRRLLQGQLDVPLLYVSLRFVATWLATWSGVPGGIFAPSLAIGAGIGADVARLTGAVPQAPALIALGMAAFLAAVTQAPLTAFIIVMEMAGAHHVVLPLMAATLLATLVSRWISRPLYPALAVLQLQRLPAAPATA
jgi:H+/Cl- antiporter ClcA